MNYELLLSDDDLLDDDQWNVHRKYEVENYCEDVSISLKLINHNLNFSESILNLKTSHAWSFVELKPYRNLSERGKRDLILQEHRKICEESTNLKITRLDKNLWYLCLIINQTLKLNRSGKRNSNYHHFYLALRRM